MCLFMGCEDGKCKGSCVIEDHGLSAQDDWARDSTSVEHHFFEVALKFLCMATYRIGRLGSFPESRH